ncbi:MAG: hypothetical protein AAF346_00880 [Pseudomonadota bacterium]
MTDSDGDADTSTVSEEIADAGVSEIAKHRVRDGEDIDSEFREQALTHKV